MTNCKKWLECNKINTIKTNIKYWRGSNKNSHMNSNLSAEKSRRSRGEVAEKSRKHKNVNFTKKINDLRVNQPTKKTTQNAIKSQ